MLTLLPPCVLQYYALQILETVIKTRWKILPRNQCEGKCLILWYNSQNTWILSVLVLFFLNVVTCCCQVEEYSPVKHAGLFSARLAATKWSGFCTAALL